jgi:hypothetical protein
VITLSLGNLAIYSAQVLLVVVAATIGARVVARSAPRPRLAFWRAVVVACLLLPLWPTRRIDVATTFSAAIATTETVRREPRARPNRFRRLHLASSPGCCWPVRLRAGRG